MSNPNFEYWVDEEGKTDTELSLSSDGFLELTEKLEDLFESFGLTREKSENEFAFIREDLLLCFNKQANEEVSESLEDYLDRKAGEEIELERKQVLEGC